MKRQLTLIPATILLAATLGGCANDDGSDAGSGETDASAGADAAVCAEPGPVSEALALEGDFGDTVTITSDLPAEVAALEKSTLITSDGDEIDADDEVITLVQVFNGTDGSLMEQTTTLLTADENYADWVLQSLNCSSIGDRVAVIVPATDVFTPDILESFGSDGPSADDSLVIVSDFTGTLPEQAEGEAVPVPEGLPEVDVDETGFPEITMPEGVDAPERLTVQTLVKGEGAVVEEGANVYVHYRGVIWETGEEFDSSWSRGTYATFNTAGVIGGFSEALVGQSIGSRVLSVVPAEDGGYGGEQLKAMGHAEDAVMVFVLDILWATPPVQF